MLIDKFKINGLNISVEFKTVSQFDSYIARITWNQSFDENGSPINWQSKAKSYGTYDGAVNWILEQIENPSFFILQNLEF